MGAANEPGVVIVGAGQAGSELATSLRTQGHAGGIVVVGDERWLPYRRPPLSKTFLAGDAAPESLEIKPAALYAKLDIEVQTGVGVETIDREARSVRLYDGRALPYSTLVLATGGHARRLAIAGADRPNVHGIRGIDDVLRLRADFVPGRRLVVVGGGYIGLETAAVAVQHGLSVTVVEAAPRVLPRVASPALSQFYLDLHRERGVDVRLGLGVHAFEGAERVETVVLADGSRIDADLVVVGIGIVPNTELAETAGLEVADGIVVDSATRTTDPALLAIGDCSHHHNARYDRRMRLESVPNAMEQARVAAALICGKPAEYRAVPWFWSDQYELKLQMVGLAEGHDRIVLRGDMGERAFVQFHLRDGVVVAADAVNRPQEFALARRMVTEGARPDPQKLGDPAMALKDLV
uniref:FAD-dependent oxidoreductase n=1 Tax=Coralloluteibacterium stylophorae TaxID=1776034 RepID=A0A8J7VY05_9GAMM